MKIKSISTLSTFLLICPLMQFELHAAQAEPQRVGQLVRNESVRHLTLPDGASYADTSSDSSSGSSAASSEGEDEGASTSLSKAHAQEAAHQTPLTAAIKLKRELQALDLYFKQMKREEEMLGYYKNSSLVEDMRNKADQGRRCAEALKLIEKIETFLRSPKIYAVPTYASVVQNASILEACTHLVNDLNRDAEALKKVMLIRMQEMGATGCIRLIWHLLEDCPLLHKEDREKFEILYPQFQSAWIRDTKKFLKEHQENAAIMHFAETRTLRLMDSVLGRDLSLSRQQRFVQHFIEANSPEIKPQLESSRSAPSLLLSGGAQSEVPLASSAADMYSSD